MLLCFYAYSENHFRMFKGGFSDHTTIYLYLQITAQCQYPLVNRTNGNDEVT